MVLYGSLFIINSQNINLISKNSMQFQLNDNFIK